MTTPTSKFEFACFHVSPFALTPSGGWRRAWETLQCHRFEKHLALVVLDTAAHCGPGNALILLQRAAGIEERVVHMTSEDLAPILQSDPFRLAAAMIEHRRAAYAWTGNEQGHLDRLTRVVRDGYLAAEPAHIKAAKRALKRREARVAKVPPPPAMPSGAIFWGLMALFWGVFALGYGTLF